MLFVVSCLCVVLYVFIVVVVVFSIYIGVFVVFIICEPARCWCPAF